MTDNIVSLAKRFISIKSTSDNPRALREVLNLALSQLEGHTMEKFEDKGVKSALVYNSKKRPKKFKIILNGHLDVVPGQEDRYRPKIKGNKLYGVGSMDMKANVACLIAVFKDMANIVSYPLALQLVTDEEVGGFHGTKHQVDRGVRADFVIAGESTNFDVVHKAKGVLLLKVSVGGKTAHGAYPWRGKNAIWRMNEFLTILKKQYPVPSQEQWVTTFNLSRVQTNNQSFNKIPDHCTVELDVRYVPEEARTIVSHFRKLLPKEFAMEIVIQEPPLLTLHNNQYLKILQKVTRETTQKKVSLRGAHGSSDARHFARVNCAGVEFGPVGGDIGGDNEWVDIPSLDKYCRILKNFLLSLNGTSGG